MSQNQAVNLSIAGVCSSGNDFSATPEGALSVGENIAIDQKNLATSRKGFEQFNDVLSGTVGVHASAITSFVTNQLDGGDSVEYVITKLQDGSLERTAGPGETAGNWYTWPGTFSDPATGVKSRFYENAKRKFILTGSGPKLLDIGATNSSSPAGIPKALDLYASLNTAPGFFDPNAVETPTAYISNGSAILTRVSSITGIQVGMYASAPGTFASKIIQDLTYTAITSGTYGNSVTIEYQNPGAPSVPLSVSVTGSAITVVLATNGSSVITSTANDINALINSSAASDLVASAVSGTGTNVQTVQAITSLTGGAIGPIPVGTKVTEVTDSAEVLITTGTTTAGSDSITGIPSTAGLSVGDLVFGPGILSGAYISGAITPTSLKISPAPIESGTGVALTFSTAPTVTLSNAATGSASSASVTFYRGSQVGYRLLFIGRDSINNQLMYGAPTGMAIAVNDLNQSASVQLLTNLPDMSNLSPSITYYVQLYRSDATGDATLAPLDQMQLVYEAQIQPSDIAAGRITILDQTPDSLKGIALYTGSDRESIFQANTPPPLCNDATLYRDIMLYANCTQKPVQLFTLLGVSLAGGSGLQAGDQIRIAGSSTITLTAVTGIPGLNQFQLVTSGTPSQNITDTTNNIINAINYAGGLSTVSPVYAYLVSTPDTLPGQFYLESKDFSAFTVDASAHGSTAWSPSLDGGYAVNPKNEPNAIYFSKSGQGNAVPTTNQLLVGDASSAIVRVLALREYALVMKTNGVYRITGLTPSSLSSALFDNTTKIVGAETASVLSNAVWMLSNQGVVSVADTGVQIRSEPIKDVIDFVTGPILSTTQAVACGVGFETQKKYILAIPTVDGDTFCPVEWEFNYITSTWKSWDRALYCMHVAPSEDRLYLGNQFAQTISKQRANGNYTDYCDEDLSVTISAVDGAVVTFASSTGIKEGDVIQQGSNQAVIVTLDNLSNTAVIANDTGITSGSCTIKTSITCTIQWKPVVNGNNPAYARQYSEGALIFKNTQFNFASLGFFTDADNSIEYVPVVGSPPTGWGLFAWGSGAWGGILRPFSVRFYVPQNKQYASQLVPILKIQNALSQWTLQGLSISAAPISMEIPSP